MADSIQHPSARSVIITRRDSPLESAIEQLIERLGDPSNVRAKLTHTFVYLEDIFTGTGHEADRHRYEAMIRNLASAQLAIIDLSMAEQSYYVLGLRQTMSNNPVIAIAAHGDFPNFADPRFIADPHPYLDVTQSDWLDRSAAICKALNSTQEQGWQSDVLATGAFRVVPQELRFSTSELHKFEWHSMGMDPKTNPGPRIQIWRHQIQEAVGFDAWVNSENIYMEMARFWDRSVSAQIRKLGATRHGPLTERRRRDSLGLALAERMGTRPFVEIGEVFVTPTDPASELHANRTERRGRPYGNGVKYIAHVATTIPDEVAGGFRAGGEIETCVRNVLRALQETRKKDKTAIKSVLFPLLGSGDGGVHPALIAHQMVVALQRLLASPDTETIERFGLHQIETIGLIAYLPSHLDYLIRELDSCGFMSKQVGA